MKKFLNIFFVTLGVIFFILLIAFGGYLVISKVFGVGGGTYNVGFQKTSDNGSTGNGGSFSISASQAAALKAFGVDPAAISNITPEQEACFVEVLGQAKVDAIKGGAVPSFSDFSAAKACL